MFKHNKFDWNKGYVASQIQTHFFRISAICPKCQLSTTFFYVGITRYIKYCLSCPALFLQTIPTLKDQLNFSQYIGIICF